MRKMMIAAALAALLGPMQSFAAQTKVTSGKTGMATATEEAAKYQPKKKSYYFVFAYKLVHPWYDAIKVGLDAAAESYKKKGITVKYDYLAPVAPDAIEQVHIIENAVGRKPDVIGVDITDVKKVVPVINQVMAGGIPVMTFAGGDAGKAEGCDRIAFIGNVDNKGDGAKLAEELAKAINFEGEVAALDGTIGAPSHEQRIEGFNEVMKKYPKIKVVARQRDDDDLEKAVNQTENFLQKYPNLKGVWCNNMTNPIGAAQAVASAGKKGKVTVVGMDHDRRTLNFVKDGTILAAQVQNNYDMGFYSIVTALKIADGARVGSGIEKEVYNVGSTTVKQDQAQAFIDMLYKK